MSDLLQRIPPLNYDLERDFKWTMEITFADQKYVAGWYKVRSDFYLSVWKFTDEKVVELAQGDIRQAVVNAVQGFASSMACDALGLRHDYVSSEKEKFLRVVKAVEQDMYIGQSTGRLYIQDVARVLHIDLNPAYRIADTLRAARLIGLDYAIIIDVAQDDANRERGLLTTGHRDFLQSDSGGWSCSACHQNGNPDEGDPYPDDLPCLSNTATITE